MMRRADRGKIVAGVYSIRCVTNGKIYIGSSNYIARRFKHHKTCLRGGHHSNAKLQNAWKVYGENAFVFTIVEVLDNVTPDELIKREQFHGVALGAHAVETGFNIAPISRTYTRRSTPAEVRMKISIGNKGKIRTPEQIKRARDAFVLAHAGKPGPNLGRVFGPEVRARMSAAQMGRQSYARTALIKAKQSSSAKTFYLTPEGQAKLDKIRVPARPCSNCGHLAKPLRRGHCGACNEYHRRTGTARPLVCIQRKAAKARGCELV